MLKKERQKTFTSNQQTLPKANHNKQGKAGHPLAEQSNGFHSEDGHQQNAHLSSQVRIAIV